MTQYWVYDRNGKSFDGPHPDNTAATNAIRRVKGKNEGKHSPSLVLEVITTSDPDYASGKSKTDK